MDIRKDSTMECREKANALTTLVVLCRVDDEDLYVTTLKDVTKEQIMQEIAEWTEVNGQMFGFADADVDAVEIALDHVPTEPSELFTISYFSNDPELSESMGLLRQYQYDYDAFVEDMRSIGSGRHFLYLEGYAGSEIEDLYRYLGPAVIWSSPNQHYAVRAIAELS